MVFEALVRSMLLFHSTILSNALARLECSNMFMQRELWTIHPVFGELFSWSVDAAEYLALALSTYSMVFISGGLAVSAIHPGKLVIMKLIVFLGKSSLLEFNTTINKSPLYLRPFNGRLCVLDSLTFVSNLPKWDIKECQQIHAWVWVTSRCFLSMFPAVGLNPDFAGNEDAYKVCEEEKVQKRFPMSWLKDFHLHHLHTLSKDDNTSTGA